jgi:PAS domain S-box-containing protein
MDSKQLDSARVHEGLALARLAAIVESSDDAIITKDLTGRITSWNAGATRIFGYAEAEIVGQPITRLIPAELQREEADILAQLRLGNRVDHFETTRIAKDGHMIDVSITVSPLRDDAGNVVGASKIARDISERRRAEKMRNLMADELNHRIKNTLSVVQAIGRQSLRFAKTNADFVLSFTDRMQSLAKTHAILSHSAWDGADLGSLIEEIVAVNPVIDERIQSSGPYLVLDSQTTIQLAMVLHELATNARKHGALSSPAGRLSIDWDVEEEARTSRLKLAWKERNGAQTRSPGRPGFGLTLIEQTIRAHGGESVMQYTPAGFLCEIRMPLSRQPVASKVTARIERTWHIPAEHGESSVLRGKRILIIEDEPLISMDLANTVAEAGCVPVGPAGDIDSAKALLDGDEFDAALLDSSLHGESTADLVAQLTQLGKPFAFITGHGVRRLPAGFRDNIVLAKPYTQGQLLVVLETLLYPALTNSRLGDRGSPAHYGDRER